MFYLIKKVLAIVKKKLSLFDRNLQSKSLVIEDKKIMRINGFENWPSVVTKTNKKQLKKRKPTFHKSTPQGVP